MQFSGRPYCLGSALYAQGKLKVQIKVICVTNCPFWVKLVRDNSGSNPVSLKMNLLQEILIRKSIGLLNSFNHFCQIPKIIINFTCIQKCT